MGEPRRQSLLQAHRATPAGDPDFFPSAPFAGRWVGELVRTVLDPGAVSVFECACGAGHLAHGLGDWFPTVYASDAYAYDGNRIFDFLGAAPPWCEADWIITNPPFGDGRAEAFIRQAYAQARRGVAMLGTVRLLDACGRFALLTRDCPLTIFAPFAERLPLLRGRWDPDASSAAFYAWFIWLKPVLRPRRFMARVAGELHPATMLIPPGTEARLTRPSDAELFGVRARELAA